VIKIGQYSYEVPAPPAMESFALQQRVFPIIGRIVGAAMHVLGKASINDLADQDVAEALPQIAPALGEVFAAMPPGELEFLTRALLAKATVSGWGGAPNVQLFLGDGGAFNGVFQGKTLEVWQLLWHALWVWYPDFFARAAALRGGGQKESASKGSTT
jgi:hypothetical protein